MEREAQESQDDRTKTIVVALYEHTESGIPLQLPEMALYLLNEEDFGISPEDFRPDVHEHAIPKYEMARIYLLTCALTGSKLGFSPTDRDSDPVYPIYERAYQKLVRLERDRSRFLGIARVGQECGFLSEGQQAAIH